MSVQHALDMVRVEYTRAIGPMAHVLLNELLATIETPPEELQLEKLVELIERLSWEIQSEQRRVQFQKDVLEQLEALR